MKLKKETEKETEQPDKILKIVIEILNFHKETQKTTSFWFKNFSTRSNAL